MYFHLQTCFSHLTCYFPYYISHNFLGNSPRDNFKIYYEPWQKSLLFLLQSQESIYHALPRVRHHFENTWKEWDCIIWEWILFWWPCKTTSCWLASGCARNTSGVEGENLIIFTSTDGDCSHTFTRMNHGLTSVSSTLLYYPAFHCWVWTPLALISEYENIKHCLNLI